MELWLLMLALLGWFWWGGTQAREAAIQSARRLCNNRGLQLLDDTVTLSQMRLKRNSLGQVQIARLYSFDFSLDGVERQQGYALLLGKRVIDLQLPFGDDPQRPIRLH